MPRDWREIAADMNKAKDDPERLSQLVGELGEALKADLQGRRTLRVNGRLIVKEEKPLLSQEESHGLPTNRHSVPLLRKSSCFREL
jgi:hypothetical protein